MHNFTFILF